MSIFPKVTSSDVDSNGAVFKANKFPVRFIMNNPITKPLGFAEGFYLYHFKTELSKNSLTPKYLYMRAEFNNAKDGESTRFITVNEKLPIGELISKLHVRYALTRTNTGYYYMLDTDYNNSTNIIETSGEKTFKVNLNLYEIQVL